MRTFLLGLMAIFALAFTLPAFASHGSDSDRTIQKANDKAKEGDYEGAEALYEAILKQNPDHEPALMGLAQVQYWQGNYQAAIETYAKVLAQEPDHVKALVGTGKAYLALGKQRKAQDFFNRAEKKEPDNEEVGAVKPQLAKKTRLSINGGYITENPSYATQIQGEFQEIRVTKEKAYSFGLNTTFLRKFTKDALETRLFGKYYFLENTRVDLAVSFSPKAAIVPRQSYEVGLAHTFWKITPEVHYRFDDYQQANLHTIRPALYFEPLEFIRVGGGYEFQNLMFGTTSRNFNGGFAELEVNPIDWISLHGFYSRVKRGFEAGRTSSPFINYKAHIAGGGISVNFMADYSIGFDAHYEKRNNGETSESYITSVGYVF